MAKDLTKRYGYGQVEPNHLSGIVTGQIYAQLPAASDIKQLENGQFAKYDYAAGTKEPYGEVNFKADADGEWMLVYNEEKLYDERFQSHKDFVYKVEDFTDGKLYPRLIKTNVGDIFTTNTFAVNEKGPNDIVEQTFPTQGTKLYIGTNGILSKTGDENGPVFKVVKVYTMPDGTPGVKIQRIQ